MRVQFNSKILQINLTIIFFLMTKVKIMNLLLKIIIQRRLLIKKFLTKIQKLKVKIANINMMNLLMI